MIFMTASAKNRTIEMIKNVMINIIALFAVIFEITSIEIPKTADGIKNIVRAFKMKEKITLPEGAASSLYPKGKIIKIGR